jgi:hypothetical protein
MIYIHTHIGRSFIIIIFYFKENLTQRHKKGEKIEEKTCGKCKEKLWSNIKRETKKRGGVCDVCYNTKKRKKKKKKKRELKRS